MTSRALACASFLLLAAGCGPPAPAAGTVPPMVAAPREPMVPAVSLQASWPANVTGTIAFHADREGRHRLFTLDLSTGTVNRVTSGRDHHDEEVAWSPDGTRLAFTTTRFDARTWDIGVKGVADDQVRRVTTHPAFDRHAAWMPDGQSLLFSSEQEGTQAVFRAWLDSGTVSRVSPPPQRALMPAASPDGTRVAYTMGTPDGLRLAVQDLATGDVRLVTPGGLDVADAQWSPDGGRLAYVRMLPGRSHIEVLALETGVVTAVAIEGLAVVREPSWSADGQWLAVAGSPVTGDREDWDLILVRPGPAGAAFRLTSGRGNDRAPSWRPR